MLSKKKVPCAWVLTFIVIPKYYCADGRKHLLEVQVSSLRQWEPGWRVATGRDGRFGAETSETASMPGLICLVPDRAILHVRDVPEI